MIDSTNNVNQVDVGGMSPQLDLIYFLNVSSFIQVRKLVEHSILNRIMLK